MRTKKNIYIIILLATAFVLSVFAFNINGRSNNNPSENYLSNSNLLNETDTLQVLIDKYAKLVQEAEGCSKETVDIRSQIKNHENLIFDLEKVQQDFNSLCDSIPISKLSKEKIDTCQLYINYLIKVKSINKNYDKLDKKVIQEIKEQLIEQNKLLNSKKNDSIKISYKLNKTISDVQQYTSRIIGSRHIVCNGIPFDLFVADINVHEIRTHLKNPKSGKNYYNLQSLINSNEFINKKLLMATNAGMYTQTNEPQGLYIENFKKLKNIDTTDTDNTLNFYLKPNGVFYIDTNETLHISTTEIFYGKYYKPKIPVKYATQSGPMLVIDGEIHNEFTQGSSNKNIRSGVGIINDKKAVFIISNDRINFYDFALLYKDIFNCKNALYLDGAISLMYLKDIAPQVTGGEFGPLISVSEK